MEGGVKEKDEKISSQDETISSLNNEVHDLRGRNNRLAEDVDLFQTRADRVEEEHRAKIEEIGKKAKIAGALWFRENTIKRYPDLAPSLEWFRNENNDESSDSSDDGSGDDGQA